MPERSADEVIRRAGHVLSRELLSEAVLLDPEGGTYFSVNETGQLVWAAMAEPVSLGVLGDMIAERFGVPPERAWDDLVAFVDDLERHGLVEHVAP